MQTASLSVLPPPSPPRPMLAERLCRPCEINLTGIARRLGIVDRPSRFIVGRIRQLAQHHDFPLPKTPRFVCGVRQVGHMSIDARSIWDRDLVDQWFDNDRPPQEAKAASVSRLALVRNELAARLALVANA